MQAIYQLLRKLVLPSNATSGARIVIDGSTDAILIYNSSNQLVESIAATAGFDAAGNNFLSAFTTYDRVNNYFLNTNGDQITMGPIVAGQPSLTGVGFLQNNGHIYLQSLIFGGFNDAVNVAFQSGTGGSASGSGLNPLIAITDSALTTPVDLVFSGTAIHSAVGGTRDTWQTPTYNTNWGGSTTFNGSVNWKAVQYRRDAMNNVMVGGAMSTTAGWTTGVAPFNFPLGYRPASQWPLVVSRNNGGTITTFMAAVSTSGNFNIVSQTGGGVAASNEFLIPPQSFPIGTIP